MNILSQYFLSTHPINPPYQHNHSTPALNTLSRYALFPPDAQVLSTQKEIWIMRHFPESQRIVVLPKDSDRMQVGDPLVIDSPYIPSNYP